MFSNRLQFVRTVKFRIALCYAVLFLVSFLIIFAVVFIHIYTANRNAADTRLNTLFSEMEYEYLTGAEPGPGQVPVFKLDKVPEDIYRQIAKELVGFTPIMAFRNAENKARYTLFGKCGQQLFRVEGESGTSNIVVQKIDFVARTQTVAAELSGEAFGDDGSPAYRLLLGEGDRILGRSPFPAEELPLFLKHRNNADSTRIRYETVNGSRHRIRMAYRKLLNGEILVLGIDMHSEDEMLERVVSSFLWVGATVFLLSALTGWVLARRMFVGVDRVGAMARKIAAGDYSLRVVSGNEGLEVENLVADFNFMVDNTEKIMTELRTISDNIAHDLRTPLTRMLACAEVTFSGKQSMNTYRDALADNAEECRRMLALINTMLEISRTESGTDLLKTESFDAAGSLRHCVELFQMAAEQKGLELSAKIPSVAVNLCGDRIKIQQIFGNLIENAVKLTPSGGKIAIALTADETRLTFSVADTGVGISDADKVKVFKRFYRADDSRNQPGNGLGLSLVQAIVHAHGGTVELESVPGDGSRFTVVLPRRPLL
ncbi:MAG: sensor histidine kinase [Victivallaceae bacterium]